MKSPPGNLLQLLKLLEGQLSAAETSSVQARLRDPQLGGRWEQLLRVEAEADAPLAEEAAADVSAEELAAFLEGALPEGDAAQVERQCWESPRLLREAISTHRFLCSHDRAAAAAPGLTQRLVELLPDAPHAAGAPAAGRPQQGDVRPATPPPLPPEARDADPTAIDLANLNPNGVDVVAARMRRRRRPVWVYYAATAAAGVALALATATMFSLLAGRGHAPAPRLAAPREDPAPLPEGEPPQVARPDAPPPSLPGPDEPTLRPPPESDVVVDDDDKSDRPPRPIVKVRPDPPRDPVPRPAPRPSYQELALQWRRIEGLLVARQDDQQDWRGAFSEPPLPADSQFATLPDSWAEANTLHGRLVLGPDTQLALSGDRRTLRIAVTRGRVAVDGLELDRPVHLRHATTGHTLQATRANTAIAFEARAGHSLVLVRRGEIRIGAQRLRQGRQAVLRQDGMGNPVEIARSTKWFDRPDTSVNLAQTQQRMLLESTNIRRDLEKLQRSADPHARLVSTRWSLALNAQHSFIAGLTAGDRKLRVETFQWLLRVERSDPRLQQALRALAAHSHDATLTREVLHWKQLARAQHPQRAQAAQMVQGLNHRSLAMRQLCAFFLDLHFGRAVNVQYDPDAPAAARQQAIREWTAALRRLYTATRPRG